MSEEGKPHIRSYQLKIEYVDVETLKKWQDNPRHHPDSQIENLLVSFKRFGYNDEILVDADGIIRAGHGRYKAALKANEAAEKKGEPIPYKKLPICRNPLKDEMAEAYGIFDNKGEENVAWDVPKLKVNVDTVKVRGCDPTEMGFNKDDLKRIDQGTYEPGGRVKAPVPGTRAPEDEEDENGRGGFGGRGGEGGGGNGALGGRPPQGSFPCPLCHALIKYDKKGRLQAVDRE